MLLNEHPFPCRLAYDFHVRWQALSLSATDEDVATALIRVPSSLARFGNKIAALTVEGDSMYPALSRGDIVVCDSCGWSGEGIYVLRMNGDGYVKRLAKRPGKIVVISDNAKYPPHEESTENESIEIVGRVHCAIKQLD